MFQGNEQGYRMTFPNGYTISVTWAPRTYSDNYRNHFGVPQRQSSTAEVWAWKGYTDKYGNPFDTAVWPEPLKYQSTSQVAEHIKYVSQLEA